MSVSSSRFFTSVLLVTVACFLPVEDAEDDRQNKESDGSCRTCRKLLDGAIIGAGRGCWACVGSFCTDTAGAGLATGTGLATSAYLGAGAGAGAGLAIGAGLAAGAGFAAGTGFVAGAGGLTFVVLVVADAAAYGADELVFLSDFRTDMKAGTSWGESGCCAMIVSISFR